MDRRNLLSIASLGAGAVVSMASCAPGGVSAGRAGMPNIIFILADDLGYGELSCYNPDADVRTPNIDRLAATGVMMTQAYASPVSSPTRTTFLTGTYPMRSGVYGNADGPTPGIGPMRHCFIEALKEAGYNTGWYGKWHQGWDVSNHPLNNGFDNAYGFLGGMHDYFDPSEGDHYVGGPFAKNCYVFDGIRPVGEMKYLTEEITDRALDFVGQVKDDRNPFFMYLAYNCPHTPMQAPDDVIIKYLNKGMDAVSATRCAMIDVMDAGIGRLLDKLESEGLRKNTLVVFMSDNGAERVRYNGGLRGTKMTAWEGGVRVPMVASYPPRIPYGTRSASICSIMDMASTFIGLAKGDDGFAYRDGVNLLPYYTGEKDGNAHESLVFAINLSGQAYSAPAPELLELFAVRSGDWKLVVDNKQGIDALYNLKDDMGESTDLSDVFADKKKELYEYGVDFLAECPPSCSKIRSVNTRINGDKIKFDSLKVHCEKLKEKLK